MPGTDSVDCGALSSHRYDGNLTPLHFCEGLINSGPFLVFVKNRRGRIIFSNRAFENYFRSESTSAVASKDFVREERLCNRRVLKTASPVTTLESYVSQDTGKKTFLTVRFPIRIDDCSTFIGGVAIDVSHFADTANLFRPHNLRGEKRLCELEEFTEGLHLAYDQVIESMKLKNSFVANISHELRTPLAAVLGMTELALSEELSEDLRGMLQSVLEAGNALLLVVNDILALTTLTSGTKMISHEQIDLSAVMAACLEPFAKSAAEKNVSVKLIPPKNVPKKLYGDAECVANILTRLLDNSLKFTRQGAIEVTASVFGETPNQALVYFSVADTGIGIDVKNTDLIFRSFMQVDDGSTRKCGGVGLGLTICKLLVETMGGVIDFESIPNGLTKFWFILPFDKHSGSTALEH